MAHLRSGASLCALVFTAGIGEHAPQIRARICDQSAWLGVRLDSRASLAGESRISSPDSAISAWVIPPDEDLMVARHTFALTRQQQEPNATHANQDIP